MKNTTAIAGLRFQKYDTNMVHVHDDVKNLKFVAKTKDFKKNIESFIKQKGDGATLVDGISKERLLLVKEDKKLFAEVLSEQDIVKDLISFIDSL